MISMAKAKSDSGKAVRTPKTGAGLMSKEEYERRESLHAKFTEEIEALKDKLVHVIAFRLMEEEFAIEISKVNEVVVTPAITRLPKTPAYVPGIATIRGNGIIMLDLAAKLGLVGPSATVAERGGYTLVVSSDRFTVGILVPEVPTNHKVMGSLIQPTGLDLAGTPEDETYIKGLIRLGEKHIFYIDIDELIEGDRMKARIASEA